MIPEISELDFKRQFSIAFMAAYCAENYSFACSHGKHEMLRNPPIEDAVHLADEAWKKWQSIGGDDLIHKTMSS